MEGQPEKEQTNRSAVHGNPFPGRRFLPWGLGIAGVVVFGITLPVTKLALADFDAGFITFARAAIAALAALIFLILTGRDFKHRQNGIILLAGMLLIFGFPGLMALALTTVDAYHGGVVLGFLPLMTALIGALLAGERHSPAFWALGGLGATITAGYAWFTGSGATGGSSGFSLGDIWLFLAALCASLGYVLSGKAARNMPGWEVICRALVLNSPLIIAGTVYFHQPHFADASMTGFVSLAYLGLFSMFLGFFAWNTALAMGGIGRIGQLQLLQTFVTLFGSAVLLGEGVDSIAVITCIVIAGIIYLARRA